MPLNAFSGYLCIVLLFLFLTLGVPVGISLGVAGFLGFVVLEHGDFVRGAAALATGPYFVVSSYVFVVIPLFILMGLFAMESGLAGDIYAVAWKSVGRVRGGLAMATVLGSAAFGTVSGSSVVNTAVFTKLGLGQMNKYGYDRKLSTGAIATSGILGMLIPPSGLMVIYGILTEQSIGKLLLGGAGPGLLLAILLCANIWVLCLIKPTWAPPSPIRVTFKEFLLSLRSLWTLPILILIITGGIYFGVFTPTEAAAAATVVTFILFVLRRGFDRKAFMGCLLETGKTSCMIFLIFIGARIFSQLVMVSGLSRQWMSFIISSNMSRTGILLGVIIMYLILGCFLDSTSMLVLTIPFIYPVLQTLNYDMTWLGVILIVAIEAGLITPPVGLNVFTLKGVAADIENIRLETIYAGAAMLFPSILLTILISWVVPGVITWLPNTMLGK